MEKISIKEFVNGYENRATDKLKEQYVKDHLEIREYVPYLEKLTACKNIVEPSLIDNENILCFNSPIIHIKYTKTIIELYTNLISDCETLFDFLDDYDLLCKNKLLQIINSLITQEEFDEFNIIYNMVYDDFIHNNSSTIKYIKNIYEKYKHTLDIIKPSLDNFIKNNIENFNNE